MHLADYNILSIIQLSDSQRKSSATVWNAKAAKFHEVSFFVLIIRSRVIKNSRVLLRVRRQTESSLAHGVCPSHVSARHKRRESKLVALRCASLFIRENYDSNSVTFLLLILLVIHDETTLTSLFCIRNVVCMPAGDGSSSVKVSWISSNPRPNFQTMPWSYREG
jgi:hypothetical protein